MNSNNGTGRPGINPWIIVGVFAAILVVMGIVLAVRNSDGDDTADKDAELEQLRLENEQLQLTNEQIQLNNEFENISTDFQAYETAVQNIDNDSIKRKYNAAKEQIARLRKELDAELKSNNKSREKIAELQAQIATLQTEISTLKDLLRHYINMVDSLGRENQGLRTENATIRTESEQLATRVAEATQKNEQLSERMTLAEKLNVSGVSLHSTKKNGKAEKNITKAQQLVVTFTIPQNNSTPVGNKNIYLRILTPEGKVCGGGGSFSFEGQNVPYTARRSIEYGGEEIPGVKMYWDVNTTLNPGTYTVELFTDGYRLARKGFTMNK